MYPRFTVVVAVPAVFLAAVWTAACQQPDVYTPDFERYLASLREPPLYDAALDDGGAVYRAVILPSSYPFNEIRQGGAVIPRMVISKRADAFYAIRIDRSADGITATYMQLKQRDDSTGATKHSRVSRMSDEEWKRLEEYASAVWSSGGRVPLERGTLAFMVTHDPVWVFEGMAKGRYRAVQTGRFLADEEMRRLMDYLHEITGLNAEARARANIANEQYLKEELAKWERVAGPEHSSIAHYLHELAELYRTQGRYTEAEPLYQRALAIWENYFGPENPYLATGLENYAKLLRETGRTQTADDAEMRARVIRAKLAPEAGGS